MNLLDDIITAITETDEKTSSILRKALVLSYRLKNDMLKSWVSKELNGYDGDDPDLPDYRVLHTQARGFFIGSFGRQIDDQPIPSAILEEQHRHWAEVVHLRQSVASYEGIGTNEMRVIPWPANMVVFYQKKFFDGDLILNRAWQDVPGSALAAIPDTVRTRVLTFVLELKDQTDEEEVDVEGLAPATVQTLVQFTIIGGNNVIGDVQQFAAQTVQVGDVESLKGTLAVLGVGHEEFAGLRANIAADQDDEPGTIGKRTLDWITRNAKAAGKGAVKIGSDIATSVMTAAIKQYLGL